MSLARVRTDRAVRPSSSMAARRSPKARQSRRASPKRQAMKPTAEINSAMAETACSAFEAIPGALDSGALIICDHASNAIPQGYGTLGLPREALERHIAYDIGAAEVTRALAGLIGAPAVLSTYSRLLIDPNSGLG